MKISVENNMGRICTSYQCVNKAFNKVRWELWKLGVLWTGSKLEMVDCVFDSFPVECVFRGAEGLWKEKLNAIVFPRFYFAGGKKDLAVDVFRHEFGHALAERYPGARKNGGVFRAAFGGSYGGKPAKGTDPADWEDSCVTPYAATATQEDLAETFMLFVKHKGKLPAKFAKKLAIRKKWKAVAEIVKRVRTDDR